MTTRSSRNIKFATRAATMPLPSWLESLAFDDRDVGVTKGVFDSLVHSVVLAALFDERANRHARDTRA